MLAYVAALVVFSSQGTDPTRANVAPAAEEMPAALVELPPGLRDALAEVASARESGDLESARRALEETIRGDAYTELLEGEHDMVLAGLSELDAHATALGMPSLRGILREERVTRLSTRLPENHLDLAAAKEDLAATRVELGDLPGALELYEYVHAARERLLPADHPNLLAAKLNLAATRAQLSDLSGALELFEYVHAAWERLLPADHPDLLDAKQNLAITRTELGDLWGAHELFESVHAARERLLPADHPDLLDAKQNLAITRRELADLPGALELCEYVYAVRERLLPADHPDLVAAKQNLAVTHYELRNLADALELFEYVHAARERLLPADHPELLDAKQNLAITRRELGDLSGALELEEYVHAVWERVLPADHPDLLRTKQNLAATRSELGDLSGALELEEYVHATRERLLPADHPDLLGAKLNLAATRSDLGDFAGARELEEYVHAAQERLLPADHPDLLDAKLNLAGTRYDLGDLAGALELLEYVHAAWERVLPADHPDLLGAKLNLAATRSDLGDFAGARELEKYVHAAWERLLPADHPDLLDAKQNLAITRTELGDLSGAHELFESVHAARERLLPADHPDLLDAKQNLAGTRSDLGDFVGALELTRSLLSSQLAIAASLRGEAPRVARALALRELGRIPQALFLDEASPRDPLAAPIFAVLEALRLASTSSSEVALALERAPELKPTRDRLARTRRELNDLGLSPPDDAAELTAWSAELFELSEERDELERDLRRALAARGVFTATPSVERVAQALDESSVLVSFFRYQRILGEDPKTGAARDSLDSLLAFVVTSDARIRRVELGASAYLEELVADWRGVLGKSVGRGVGVTVGPPETSEAFEDREVTAGGALRANLLDPCFAALGRRPASVYLVLDDFLHLVPVDALPTGDGKRLGEVVRVRFEVSTGRLIRPARPVAGEGTLVALGGVDFDAGDVEPPKTQLAGLATPPTGTSQDREGAPGGFRPLVQTRYEVETLGGLYSELVGGEPVVVEKARASKKALVELAPRARFLHVATHGWFAPEAFKSMIDSAEEQAVRARFARAEDTVRGFAPETLCGLALAGANHGKDALGKVPGIITAEELATLDLSNCELAVLSACETNVGIRRAGQGIQSLQAALHSAGARTAITSLWRVDDAATRRLMELFYTKLWQDGLGKADALWQAKMALRGEGYPVRDWAGWVLTGAPD